MLIGIRQIPVGSSYPDNKFGFGLYTTLFKIEIGFGHFHGQKRTIQESPEPTVTLFIYQLNQY
jgi:hypothetical protein